jgi:hypothetical protein
MCAEKLGPDQWENLADVLRSIEPELENRLTFCRTHIPDPKTQPATSAIIQRYVRCLELQLSSIRRGAPGLKSEFRNHPELTEELEDIQSWIMRKVPGAISSVTEKDEDAIGDWFVSKMGYSFSTAKRRLDEMRRRRSGKGAPSKRPETLKMLDARLANGWSYSKLANNLCDCGAKEHTEHCSERIRKRLKELHLFLDKWKIVLPATPEINQD